MSSPFSNLVAILGLTPALSGSGAGEPKDFVAKNQDGKEIHLSNYRGHPVLIYFYPKDDTPGCTKESCDLRDNYAAYQKLGAVIFGVSKQDEQSHREFKNKYKLPFDLLVDSDGSVAKVFGVEQRPILGYHKRQSVLIAPDGKIAKFYADVDPQTHNEQVLKDLRALFQPPKGENAAHP